MGQVALTINERRYEIACGDGEEARLAELGAYVDAKVGELRRAVGQIPETKLLLMACVLIADELFESRERQGQAPGAAAGSGDGEDPAADDEARQIMARHVLSLAERIEAIAARLEQT